MKIIDNVLHGADIEFFVKDTTANEIISAEGLIPGTKKEPFIFDPAHKDFAISLDNILAEICIPPARNKQEFYANIDKSRGYVDSILPKQCTTIAFPAFSLDPKWLQTENAMEFGCDPDFDAYTGLENVKPSAADNCLRSAGFHLHTSYDNHNTETNRLLIRAYDLFIAIPGLFMEPDNRRKQLYGKAGAHREKKYGVEYRSPSNYFVSSQQLVDWLYDSANLAIDFINAGNVIEGTMASCIKDTINTKDMYVAKELMDHFNLKIAA